MASAARPGAPFAPPPPAPGTTTVLRPTPTPAAQPQGTANVTFEPSRLDKTVGSQFNVAVTVQNVKDLFNAPMTIKYDPKILRLNDVAQGNLLSAGGPAVFTKNIQNDAGEADIAVTRPPGSGGVSSSGTLITLTFTALAPGTASVTVDSFRPTNSQGQVIDTTSPVLTVNVK
jgi:general secretion pathway protein D